MALRPYQTELVFNVLRSIAAGNMRVMLQLPTGAGKTQIGADLARRHAGGKLLYIVPSDEILEQTSRKLSQAGVRHIQLRAGVFSPLGSAECILAMSQTLARRIGSGVLDGWNPGLIIIDEAHKLIDQHRAVLTRWKCPVVGFSATPVRLDGKPLHTLWPTLIAGPSIHALQRQGFLVPARALTATVPDLSKLRMRAGDYDLADLSDAYSTHEMLHAIAAWWKRAAAGRRTIAFTAGIAASKGLVQAYRAIGVRAEHVDGSYSRAAREGALERLRRHQIDVLCNCNLFVEGLDLVETECIQLATSTKSLGRYLQMVGRGLRPSVATGKRDVLMIDHGSMVAAHGPVDADRDWCNEGRQVSVSNACPICGNAMSNAGAAACADCIAKRMAQAAPLSPLAQERAERGKSMATAARPVPPWAARVAEHWRELERLRVMRGTPLEHTESRCRRYLTALA